MSDGFKTVLPPAAQGDLDLGGVLQATTRSLDGTVEGTRVPTRRRSVEPSSMPRPSQRPQGNLRETIIVVFNNNLNRNLLLLQNFSMILAKIEQESSNNFAIFIKMLKIF